MKRLQFTKQKSHDLNSEFVTTPTENIDCGQSYPILLHFQGLASVDCHEYWLPKAILCVILLGLRSVAQAVPMHHRYINHRSKGGVSSFASQTFYNGRMVEEEQPELPEETKLVRQFF
ncbi:hypothetical protein F5Y09DRAFT_306627 [Xylaria sp. FL1042]|nr:hypothetical protein F5Y09DRAFT_306627 [Xylaria sp. FL1042]